MTNDDELLKRLENDPVSRAMALEAASRICELKAERDEAVTQMLEAKLANKGVVEGTHVIVPVEPTEAMLKAGWSKWDSDYGDCRAVYHAMIRAAQERVG